jgi:hypothetical protein
MTTTTLPHDRLPIRRGWLPALLRLAAFAAAAGPVILAISALLVWPQNGFDSAIVLILFLAAVLLIPAIVIYFVAVAVEGSARKRQQVNDTRAEAILDAVLSRSDHGPFVLYLRPFAVTGVLNRRSFLRRFWKRLGYEVEFEAALVQALSRWAPVIAVGHSGEQVGFGRVQMGDAEWKKLVANLIDQADAVFMLPGASRGTTWEVRYILKTAADKAVFMMPPKCDAPFDSAKYWMDVRSHWSRHRVHLPEYDERGMFFRLHSGGGISETNLAPRSWSDRPIRKALDPFREVDDEADESVMTSS